MANPEHVDRLKRGIKEWNQWRVKEKLEENGDLKITFQLDIDLSGADLNKENLRDARLFDANLSGVNLYGANLIDANLSESNLYKAILQNADLHKADLYKTDLHEADLSGANLNEVYMIGANLSKANLRGANLSKADLREANLSKADLLGANLRGADLRGADLHDANLFGVIARGATLRATNLRKANLLGANLREVDLSEANLLGADLRDANLRNADLNNTDLHDTILLSTTFAKVDLSTAKGLTTIKHRGPSYIELFSVKLPQDSSALHFLRGAGVPDEWIDYWRASNMSPIQYHSCFISYCSADEFLAQRLHADLQVKGVRCWFAKKDMKIGNKIRERIDQAIHIQDKLLLLLSEHSIQSDWVETEVEIALEKERRQQREVLFPVRIDESIMETKQAWARHLRLKRHIGDFTLWSDPQAYTIAFERLLRDLKQE